jgi:DNA polymerase-4
VAGFHHDVGLARAPSSPGEATDPCILHVDFDAFFASVEQMKNPALRNRPVIVGTGCIASCSYEARRFGLKAGMPLAEARGICPGAVVLGGDQRTYAAFAERVFDLCREVSPAVESYLDEAYCDLTGTARLHGDALETARRLKRRIRSETGLSVTAGIGTNRMIAKLAGRSVKPDGLALVRAGEEEAFLAGREVRDLPGVGRKTAALLSRMNVETVDDLRHIPCFALRRLLGRAGEVLYERSRGGDPRAMDLREVPRSVSRETTFHEATADEARIQGMLYYLTERAARFLRGRGFEARTVGVRIRYSDMEGGAISETLGAPTALDRTLFAVAQRLLRAVRTRRVALRLVGVRLERLSLSGASQMDFLEREDDAWERRLVRGLDEVRSRYGHSAVVAGRSVALLGVLRQSPDGFVLRTPSLAK